MFSFLPLSFFFFTHFFPSYSKLEQKYKCHFSGIIFLYCSLVCSPRKFSSYFWSFKKCETLEADSHCCQILFPSLPHGAVSVLTAEPSAETGFSALGKLSQAAAEADVLSEGCTEEEVMAWKEYCNEVTQSTYFIDSKFSYMRLSTPTWTSPMKK